MWRISTPKLSDELRCIHAACMSPFDAHSSKQHIAILSTFQAYLHGSVVNVYTYFIGYCVYVGNTWRCWRHGGGAGIDKIADKISFNIQESRSYTA